VSKDQIFTYEIDGKIFVALRHVCLQCDEPMLIDGSKVEVNGLFFCSSCGLDSRMSAGMVDQVRKHLRKMIAKKGKDCSVPATR
jgi:hypothetical protein